MKFELVFTSLLVGQQVASTKAASGLRGGNLSSRILTDDESEAIQRSLGEQQSELYNVNLPPDGGTRYINASEKWQPFASDFATSRYQALYTKAELEEAGMIVGCAIQSMSFRVAEKNTPNTFGIPNFRVSIGAITGKIIGSNPNDKRFSPVELSKCNSAAPYFTTEGWNSVRCMDGEGFVWDGSTSIIVETRHSGGSNGYNIHTDGVYTYNGEQGQVVTNYFNDQTGYFAHGTKAQIRFVCGEAAPSSTPSSTPTETPSATKTLSLPSAVPSVSPTDLLSVMPTESPSTTPSLSPTHSTAPSLTPSALPSTTTSNTPSVFPTKGPFVTTARITNRANQRRLARDSTSNRLAASSDYVASHDLDWTVKQIKCPERFHSQEACFTIENGDFILSADSYRRWPPSNYGQNVYLQHRDSVSEEDEIWVFRGYKIFSLTARVFLFADGHGSSGLGSPGNSIGGHPSSWSSRYWADWRIHSDRVLPRNDLPMRRV